ncbi:zonular occludens toxin domain-containing protein [Snodgrassella sp. CFCC 13594]|uniref:zonular occludens toxin domain-containing protein n=1 Tax=Snodgrassella sp. CFCC 13594 TaxID=1775559 RepID=UPI00082F9CE0|nr:zonular occludens toxin domain-containing protein [Snodgrassella sp. CFCC 13594]
MAVEIVLVTGKPRIGKTAFVVDLLANDARYKGRKLFSNINGLLLPHEQPPEGHSWEDMHVWLKWPENKGAIVAYDEVQNLFPSRANGAKMSDNVLFLNVHGHYAIDMFFITQGTKIIDVNLRETVNRHIHVAANKMGGLTRLEWAYCANNPLGQAKDAISSTHKINENVFELYKSAEAHIAGERKRSNWFYVIGVMLIVLPLLLCLIGFMGYKIYKGFQAKAAPTQSAQVHTKQNSNIVTGDMVQSVASGTLPTPQPAQAQPLTAEMYEPTMEGQPQSKPLYNSVRVVKSYERIAACIKGGKSGCTCYSDQATPLKEVTNSKCIEYAANGLPFDPFRESNPQSQNTSKVSQSGSQDSQVTRLDSKAPDNNLMPSTYAPGTAN